MAHGSRELIVTKHYIGDSKISSAERDALLSGPGKELRIAELVEMAQAAGETHAIFAAWIQPRMTRERALRVRQLRVDEGWSYRLIAGTLHLEWGSDANWQPITNQLAGVALCEAAAELLGEDVQAWPWQANQA